MKDQNSQVKNSTNVRDSDWLMRLTQTSTHYLHRLSPKGFTAIARDYLFRPGQMRLHRNWGALLDEATHGEQFVAKINKRIRTYHWGRGPTVVLVHGWGGRGLQLGSFVEPLVSQGLSVLTYDQPAHGESSGYATNFFEFLLTLRHLIENEDHVHGFIAHSMGCAATLAHLSSSTVKNPSVLLAPQADFSVDVRSWASHSGMDSQAFEDILRRLEQHYELDLDAHSAPAITPKVKSPVLLVHDKNDRPVPHDNSLKLQQLLSHSELILTEGLGHNRILRDKSIIERAADWLANGN